MRQTQVTWAVLLDEDEWENESGNASSTKEQIGEGKGQPTGRRWMRRALLLAPLLLLISLTGFTFWDAVNAAQRSVGQATPSRPPISADAMAANTRSILLTEHLRIAASGTDIAVVGASREMMETLYGELFRSLGVAPAHSAGAPDGRLFVEVRGVGAPVWDQARGRVTLPSPASLSAPSQTNAQALLRQAWVLALIDQATREAIQTHQIPQDWFPLLSGLRLWLLLDAGDPLADGWGEVIKQLHRQERIYLSNAAIQDICQKYAVWDLAPIDFSIRLGCDLSVTVLPVVDRLSELGLAESFETQEADRYGISWQITTGRSVALALLLQYAAETHWRAKIPALLAALQTHDSWQTLIPAVFNVSVAAEFEAGWQEWLAESYGLQDAATVSSGLPLH